MTRIKQDRSRKAGYTGSMNAQDFDQVRPSPLDLTLAHVRAARQAIWLHGSKLLPVDRGNLLELIKQLDLMNDFLVTAGAQSYPAQQI